MVRALFVAAAVAALAACATAQSQPADPTLAALMAAKPKACPVGAEQPDARSSGEGPSRGIAETELGRAALVNDSAGRSLRMRRLVIGPGGVLAWHDHAARPAMGMVVSGEMVEYRKDCREPLTYRAGDISVETAGVAHWWRNESSADAVFLAFDAAVLP